jgi:hypothetical protein
MDTFIKGGHHAFVEKGWSEPEESWTNAKKIGIKVNVRNGMIWRLTVLTGVGIGVIHATNAVILLSVPTEALLSLRVIAKSSIKTR